MSRTLHTVVFLGSARNVVPPWGGDARLGDRVFKYVVDTLRNREREIGGEKVTHKVTVFDPLEVFGEGGALEQSGGHLTTPHFFLGQGKAPKKMDEMREIIKQANCFVIVTPEYNHSIPPALSSMMSHFGGSNFALKTSAIVTYSPGPWGGMRAAMALRPFLSELGCIPVSKLTAFPQPVELFNENGEPNDPGHRMLKQLPQMLNELEWTALAFDNMKRIAPDPHA